ncbi:MAG: hypothetical protein VYE40_02765 [Myxococcota bacterium]|nr:hypothetical protein [Myxococcota bacterium]
MFSKPTLMRTLRLLLFIGLTSQVACAGCRDEPTGPPKNTPVVLDMNGGNGDMNGNNDSDMGEPDPDLPAPTWAGYVVIEVDPLDPLYRTGDEVQLTATLFDTDEAAVEGATFDWKVEPAGAAELGEDNTWTIASQGEIIFEACSMMLDFDGAPVCDRQRIVVDDAPPSLEITSPQPGEEIDGSLQQNIVVTGVATDENGELALFINGQSVDTDKDGNFSIELSPEFGINHIEVVASDGLNRSDTVKELDVLWAPAWEPGIQQEMISGTEFEDGLLLHLGRRFFDDGRPPLTNMEGASFTEDLADILTLLIRYIDLTSLIPNPVVDSDDLSLTISNFSLGRPTIEIDITEGGIALYLSADNLVIDTVGQLTVSDQTLDLTGTISAGIGILAAISIDKDGIGQPFVVEVTELEVAIERADSNFVDPEADAIFELAQSALRLQIETVLVDALRSSFIDTIPTLLSDALNGIETALSGQSFPLEPGFVDPIDVTFSGRIEELEKNPRQSIEMRLRTSLVASTTSKNPSLGTPMMQPFESGAIPLLQTSRIQIALRLALINGLLHGLWDAGLLDIDATDLLPEDLTSLVEEATVHATLPPVAVPPTKGEPYDLFLQIGQLELSLKSPLTGQTVIYGVNLSAGVNVGVTDNELAVTIAEEPIVKIWVIETDDGKAARLKPSQLEGLFRNQLWPELTGALGEGLGLPLPALEIPELGTYAPELSTFTLSFDQAGPIVVRDGFVIVESRLRGTLPAPMNMMP